MILSKKKQAFYKTCIMKLIDNFIVLARTKKLLLPIYTAGTKSFFSYTRNNNTYDYFVQNEINEIYG